MTAQAGGSYGGRHGDFDHGRRPEPAARPPWEDPKTLRP